MIIDLMRLTVLVSTNPTHMKATRISLYAALVLSFIASLLYRPATWLAFEKGEAQLFIPLLAPIAFALFVIGYTTDRYFLVRSGSIPLIRAVMQVGFALVFLTFLARGELREYKDANEQRAASDNISLLLKHREAAVRAQTCEVLGYRGGSEAKMLIQSMSKDVSPSVRTRCRKALEHVERAESATIAPSDQPQETATEERVAE